MPRPPSRPMGLNGVFYPTQLLDLHFDEIQLSRVEHSNLFPQKNGCHLVPPQVVPRCQD